MLARGTSETTENAARINAGRGFFLAGQDELNSKIYAYLAKLSSETPWGHRQIAAQELGAIGSPKALPGLLSALSSDPFWMVRCAIIQALEKIGDPGAVPTLRQVAQNDGFSTVRSYARKAIERLSAENRVL